jgi:translation initiation factor 1A
LLALGLDQPGRHRSHFAPRVPGREGRRHRQVHVGRGAFFVSSGGRLPGERHADRVAGWLISQARNLKSYGELPDTAKINETDAFGEDGDDDGVEFGGDSDIDDI